jgi:hypothetical protein
MLGASACEVFAQSTRFRVAPLNPASNVAQGPRVGLPSSSTSDSNTKSFINAVAAISSHSCNFVSHHKPTPRYENVI